MHFVREYFWQKAPRALAYVVYAFRILSENQRTSNVTLDLTPYDNIELRISLYIFAQYRKKESSTHSKQKLKMFIMNACTVNCSKCKIDVSFLSVSVSSYSLEVRAAISQLHRGSIWLARSNGWRGAQQMQACTVFFISSKGIQIGIIASYWIRSL